MASKDAHSGIGFDLGLEQHALRELARDFALNRIRPHEAAFDRSAAHPEEIIGEAHALGLMNVHVPERFGGLGLSPLDGVLVNEELCFGCSGIGTAIVGNCLGLTPIIMVGSEDQQARYLPVVTESPALCAFALTEAEAGSDPAAMKTTARSAGDAYVLNGSKAFITSASHATFFVVFAVTAPGQGNRGISAFIVDRDSAGLTIENHLDKLGQRAADTAGIAFDDVVVPASNRLGAEGEGFEIAMRTLDQTRSATAAGAVGVARAAFEHARAYAATRVTFGVPIARHQAVAFMIADMATTIDAARLLAWRAAWLVGRGRRATLESAHAKRFAADTAMAVTTDAVQVFGGYGYTKDYPVEKLMRDAKIFQIYEGTSQIQRLVIARETMRGIG